MTNIRLNGQSESTLLNYGRCLAKLALYFRTCPTTLPDAKINEYLLLLRDSQQPSFSYFKHTVYGFRLAFRLIEREDRAIRLPSIKRIKSLPLVLNRSEVKELIATPKWKKHRILIALIYSAGLKIGEVDVKPPIMQPKTPIVLPVNHYLHYCCGCKLVTVHLLIDVLTPVRGSPKMLVTTI